MLSSIFAWNKTRRCPTRKGMLGACLWLASFSLVACSEDDEDPTILPGDTSPMGSVSNNPGTNPSNNTGMGANTSTATLPNTVSGMGMNSSSTSTSSSASTSANSSSNSESNDTSGSGSTGNEGDAKKLYSFGHADIAITFDSTTKHFVVELDTDRATVDGVAETSVRVPIESVIAQTPAKFQRPVNDNGVLDPLCIQPGESLHWFPQDNTESANQNAPFFGWSSRVAIDQFVDDRVHIHLISATPSVPGGHFSMWRMGVVEPEFYMSTCDGISEADVFSMLNSHVHRNITLSGPPAMWTVIFEIRATLAADQQLYKDRFTVNIQTL